MRLGRLLPVALLLSGQVAAQPFFEAVTDGALSRSYLEAIGLTFGDYNNDGWPDLFLAERTREVAGAPISGVAFGQRRISMR